MVEKCFIERQCLFQKSGYINLLLGYEYKLQLPNKVGNLKSSEASHNRKTKLSSAIGQYIIVQQTCYLGQVPQNLLQRAQ